MNEVLAPRCVLFDAVGTLLYADPPVADAYRAAGLRCGANLAIEEVERRFRTAFAQTMHDDGIASPERERRRWEFVVGEVFREWPSAVHYILDELWQHFSNSPTWRLFGDAAPVLHELQQRGYLIGVASNFDERLVGVCRGHAVLADLPLFWSSDIGFSKPHPQFFARVSERIKVSSRDILLVGDDEIADFQGATAAGWRALLVDRQCSASSESQIGSLAELPALLASSPAGG